MTVRARKARRTRVPGRVKVLLGLALIVVVFLLANWRRSIGIARGVEIDSLNVERATLLSLRSSLKRELSVATSRDRIVLAAQRRLGLHVANELQTRFIVDSVIPVLAGTGR